MTIKNNSFKEFCYEKEQKDNGTVGGAGDKKSKEF